MRPTVSLYTEITVGVQNLPPFFLPGMTMWSRYNFRRDSCREGMIEGLLLTRSDELSCSGCVAKSSLILKGECDFSNCNQAGVAEG